MGNMDRMDEMDEMDRTRTRRLLTGLFFDSTIEEGRRAHERHERTGIGIAATNGAYGQDGPDEEEDAVDRTIL